MCHILRAMLPVVARHEPRPECFIAARLCKNGDRAVCIIAVNDTTASVMDQNVTEAARPSMDANTRLTHFFMGG